MKKERHINIEKALHLNLISNEFENPEDKKELISKVKNGQKIYQLVLNDRVNLTNSNINYNKNIKKMENKNNIKKDKKEKTNYVRQYHKRINSNTKNHASNNSKKKYISDNKEKNKHSKTRSDIINYDYLFSIYNEINKKNDNLIKRNKKKFNTKNQSMDHFLQESIKEEEEDSYGNNEIVYNHFFSSNKQCKFEI